VGDARREADRKAGRQRGRQRQARRIAQQGAGVRMRGLGHGLFLPSSSRRFVSRLFRPAFCHRCHKDRHGAKLEKRGKVSGIMAKMLNILPIFGAPKKRRFRPIDPHKKVRSAPIFFAFG
jgi:hypothetical protein